MTSRGFGTETQVAIPLAYRNLYVQATVGIKLHGRSRVHKAKKAAHHALHGRTRSEPMRNDPFKHKGQAHGQH
jgi:hypothetical protein